ncbi:MULTISPECIES: hypothetical protein [unclassified Crossiella]|uniref:hypothetical protein n=1 Tax=unclassified Crossiella TaxID=2620835 RepID=UPI0027E3C934|nr:MULTISPECIES: hypothetical protein [unclassified Crossiella]
MATLGHDSSSQSSTESAVIVRAVTVIMGTVVGLTFLFGFGNVLNLALRLGVPVWVAPLVAPAIDLSILGLLLGTRHLALTGASADVLRPARRLLIFASVVTLALNVADPLVAGAYGKAAFDAVGPLLLIGWAEVGPGFLQAIHACREREHTNDIDVRGTAAVAELGREAPHFPPTSRSSKRGDRRESNRQESAVEDSARGPQKQADRNRNHLIAEFTPELVDRAVKANAEHIREYGREIASETLRHLLRQDGIPIGATRVRRLARLARSASSSSATRPESDRDCAPPDGGRVTNDDSASGGQDVPEGLAGELAGQRVDDGARSLLPESVVVEGESVVLAGGAFT